MSRSSNAAASRAVSARPNHPARHLVW